MLKRNLSKIILAASLLVFVPSCSTVPKTHEAIVFNSFASTWATAHAAYGAYAELAVQNKISERDQKDIDAAWNKFRGGFKLALIAAQNNWNAASPDEVNKLKDDLIILIRAL